jgi:hypothetical protein
MGRCEGYYRIENRRCDRDAAIRVPGGDGETYAVCAYHVRDRSRTQVARWDGESGIRRSAPIGLTPEPLHPSLAAAAG